MYEALARSKMSVDTLCNDSSTLFHIETIFPWHNASLSECMDMLRRRGKHIKPDKNRIPTENLMELLYREVDVGSHPHRLKVEAGNAYMDKIIVRGDQMEEEKPNSKRLRHKTGGSDRLVIHQ